MHVDGICKLAERFYNLAKQAGIVENMAARVLFSTTPSNIDNVIALRALVPGARELVHYGSKAVLGELSSYIAHSGLDKITLQKYQNLITKLESLLASGNMSAFLSNSAEIFISPDLSNSVPYGGQSWHKITLALLTLSKTLDKLKVLSRDNPDYITTLKQLTADMNIIDGLAHNTGLLVDKMLDLEADDKGNFDLDRREETFNKVQRILTLKML